MKKAVLFALTACCNFASADIIKCTFTEPFIDTEYSMTQSTLTYKSFENKDTVIKNVSFQIKGPGVFELVSKDGKVLQVLTLNNQGSDGMSDKTYPYEVKDNSSIMSANNGYGGCTSNYLHATETEEI